VRTAAVICKTASHTRGFAKELQKPYRGQLSVLSSRNDERSANVVVAPAYLVKGMEFDLVVIVDADDQHYGASEYDSKLLYIAATRALHRLVVVWAGEPSPLISLLNIEMAAEKARRQAGPSAAFNVDGPEIEAAL